MTRRAIIRTRHDDPATVARAVSPDNTDEMETTLERSNDALESDTVVTRIERETTGGLHSTVDDYVVNVGVAETVAQHGRTTLDAPSGAADTDYDTQ